MKHLAVAEGGRTKHAVAHALLRHRTDGLKSQIGPVELAGRRRMRAESEILVKLVDLICQPNATAMLRGNLRLRRKQCACWRFVISSARTQIRRNFRKYPTTFRHPESRVLGHRCLIPRDHIELRRARRSLVRWQRTHIGEGRIARTPRRIQRADGFVFSLQPATVRSHCVVAATPKAAMGMVVARPITKHRENGLAVVAANARLHGLDDAPREIVRGEGL